jgi:hypothetical protein
MSWQERLGINLIKNVEVKIGDNKTIAEMVDGNLKVEHYYKNEIIIEKPVHIGVDTITSPNRPPNSNNNARKLKKNHCVACNFVCSNKYTYMQHIIDKRHNTSLNPLQNRIN